MVFDGTQIAMSFVYLLTFMISTKPKIYVDTLTGTSIIFLTVV